jgi:molecular chaperone GrpE
MTDHNPQDDTLDIDSESETLETEKRVIDDESDMVIDEEAEMATPQIVKSLREKLKKAVEEKQTYLTNWQKDKAEFINARRRDEESKQEFLKYANQGVIEELLPVLDSFDMAMANKTAWESVSKEWRVGMEGVYTQLSAVLQKHGAIAFGAIGDTFDPNLHHSIGLTETKDTTQDNKIAEVMQKGYSVSGKVIRPALVKVYNV